MRAERWLYSIPLRLRSIFSRNRVEQELDEELRDHLERKTLGYVAAGLSPEQARRSALRDMDGVELRKEQCRDARRVNLVETLFLDARYALRALRKSPSFTSVAVLTLALGIGANTAFFSVVKGVLLDSLPYYQSHRLVAVARGDSQNTHPTNVSYGEVADWKARSRSFEQIALSRGWTPASSGDGAPEIVFGLRVTRNFFDTLGVSPYLGRGFLPDEDRPQGWHVVLVSYPYWLRRFGGNPNAVGQTILLDQAPFQIVGVLPKSFDPLSFTDAGSPPEVWAPLGYDLSIPDACRTCQHLHAVARLSDGVDLGHARAELNSIASKLAREFPDCLSPFHRLRQRRQPALGSSSQEAPRSGRAVGSGRDSIANLAPTPDRKHRSQFAGGRGRSAFGAVGHVITEPVGASGDSARQQSSF